MLPEENVVLLHLEQQAVAKPIIINQNINPIVMHENVGPFAIDQNVGPAAINQDAEPIAPGFILKQHFEMQRKRDYAIRIYRERHILNNDPINDFINENNHLGANVNLDDVERNLNKIREQANATQQNQEAHAKVAREVGERLHILYERSLVLVNDFNTWINVHSYLSLGIGFLLTLISTITMRRFGGVVSMRNNSYY